MIKGFYKSKYTSFYKVRSIRQHILTNMIRIPEIYHMHGHSDYVGNEMADEAAEIAQGTSIELNHQLFLKLTEQQKTLVRQIKDLHSYTTKYWDTQWKHNSIYFDSNSKVHCQSLITSLSVAVTLNKNLRQLSNRAAKSIFRLVAGYCNLRFYQYRWKLGVSSPLCLHCNEPETVSHFLLTCDKYDQHRQILFNKLSLLFRKSNSNQQPPTTLPLGLILVGSDLDDKYKFEALQALSEFIRLTRVKL